MSQLIQDGGTSSLSADMLNARVTDADGNSAVIVSLRPDDSGTAASEQALLRLDGGPDVLLPVGLLSRQADGSYRLPFSFRIDSPQHAVQLRFPVLEEELEVGKRVVETGGVRIHKSVTQREELLDQPLLREELVVEHVPVGRMLADGETPHARQEGDTLVVPVLEEVLVVEKRLMLKEEVRVTRRQQEFHAPQTVVLRSEQIKVERFE